MAENTTVAVKVGPWGASGGQPQDINKASKPQSLVSITACSSKSLGGPILGFSFTYVDQNDNSVDVGPWGNIDPQQRIKTIKMDPDEYLYDLSGTANDSALFSLRLVTNKHVYEIGSPLGPAASFSVPLQQGKVVAFFGRSDNTPGAEPSFMALGIYVAPMQGWPVKIGPWGPPGSGGTQVDINTPVQLKSVTVHSGRRIYGFSFTYIDQHGDSVDVHTWGTTKGQEDRFYLNQGEYLNKISGTFDDVGVTSLKFTSNKNYVHGPYGCERGTAFSVPLPPDDGDDNGAVVGFFGRSGESLVALGVYVGLAPNEP